MITKKSTTVPDFDAVFVPSWMLLVLLLLSSTTAQAVAAESNPRALCITMFEAAKKGKIKFISDFGRDPDNF